jgi:3-mercaptopyruvate sulfurtransferase SseA
VRNRSELASKGKFPNSINVPLHEILSGAFLWPNTDFKIRYGINKPAKCSEFVVSCQTGIRASKAGKYLKSLGYQQVETYKGSFDDWISNGGEIIEAGNDVDESLLWYNLVFIPS